MKVKPIATFLFATYTCAVAPIADACTGITLKAKDGAVVFARTCEWGTFDLHSRIVLIPRGQEFTGHTPDNKPGRTWKGQHGFLALDAPAWGEDILLDGMNEKGLAVNGFYLPGFTEYQAYDVAKASVSIGPGDLIPYLLSTSATVEEAKAALAKVRVTPVVSPSLGIAPPGHFMITEPSGKAIVIEYVRVNSSPTTRRSALSPTLRITTGTSPTCETTSASHRWPCPPRESRTWTSRRSVAVAGWSACRATTTRRHVSCGRWPSPRPLDRRPTGRKRCTKHSAS